MLQHSVVLWLKYTNVYPCNVQCTFIPKQCIKYLQCIKYWCAAKQGPKMRHSAADNLVAYRFMCTGMPAISFQVLCSTFWYLVAQITLCALEWQDPIIEAMLTSANSFSLSNWPPQGNRSPFYHWHWWKQFKCKQMWSLYFQGWSINTSML